jgi:hypothetical protein
MPSLKILDSFWATLERFSPAKNGLNLFIATACSKISTSSLRVALAEAL